jgi:hypothetical protein
MVCTLTLGEESMLRVFENRVLMRTVGPKRNEVVGEWRKLRNEELNDFYSSPNIRVVKFRRMRRGAEVFGKCGGTGEVDTGFWWETSRKEFLGRPRCRLEIILQLIIKTWNVGHGLD